MLQEGNVFEKAGVNISIVHGHLSEERAKSLIRKGKQCTAGSPYSASALSFVLHAQSPFVPTLRGDVRVFMNGGEYWAGGGVDLTIFYCNRAQITAFHRHWKTVCDEFDCSYYSTFKKQCDEYFYIPSRKEYRGVGGIFYDDLYLPWASLVAFQQRVLDEALPSYRHIVDENMLLPWTAEQKRWQRIRRGRYIEFNLLFDRGVKFGVASGDANRTESILISAPPSVEWPHKFTAPKGSPEDETLQLLQQDPKNWVEE